MLSDSDFKEFYSYHCNNTSALSAQILAANLSTVVERKEHKVKLMAFVLAKVGLCVSKC